MHYRLKLALIFGLVAIAIAGSFHLPLYVSLWTINFFLIYALVVFLLFYLQSPDEGKPRKLENAPSLALVIASYNSMRTIEKCLAAVKAMRYPKRVRIIVVDDGSTDQSREWLEKQPNIELIKQPKNAGKAHALNEGLARVTEELVACIDSDTYPEPDVLEKLVPFHDDPKIGAVTGLMVPENRKNFVQKVQFFEYAVGFGLWNTVLSSIGGMTYIPGPLTIFKRKMFEKIGGFDPDNLTEDMEIGLRIQAAHYQIKVCPYAVVETDVPDDWNKLAKQRDRWYRGRVYNLFKYQELVFNQSFGHLGFFSLPFLFLLELAGVFVFGRLLILIAQNLLDTARTLFWTVGAAHILPPLELGFVLSTQHYFLIVAFSFVIAFFGLGLSMANYRFKIADTPAILVSLFLYPLFVTYTYIKSFIREMRGKKAVWQRVST